MVHYALNMCSTRSEQIFHISEIHYVVATGFSNMYLTVDLDFELWFFKCHHRWHSVTIQISTSVQQTTEVVLLKPAALTPRVASRVPVYLDIPEMDLPAQVNENF